MNDIDIILGATGDQAIGQALRTIILTEQGSVPFRPRLGLGITKLLGGGTRPIDITEALTEQIENYEKRIKVKSITVNNGSAIGSIILRIRYQLKSTGEEKAYIKTIEK